MSATMRRLTTNLRHLRLPRIPTPLPPPHRAHSTNARNRIAPINAPRPSVRLNTEINGKLIPLDQLWLRDACPCPRCVHPNTQQKLFQTSDLNSDVYAQSNTTLPDGSLQVQWANDILPDHTSVYPASFLRRYSTPRNRVRERYNDPPTVLWDGAKMERDVLYVDYDAYMGDDKALLTAVRHLSRYGLCFVRNIPAGREEAVAELATRIGPLKSTFYGPTWNVKSSPDSKNIAYTSLNLGHHMDLLYFESPPGLQFLHSLKNTTTGGTSLFSDSFRAAELVRLQSPHNYAWLTRYPVTFQYVNDNQHYTFTRPTIVEDPYTGSPTPKISHTNYAPPFQAPFEAADAGIESKGAFRSFASALKEFAHVVDAPKSQFELLLEEGTCAIFFNRRILHSRREFDPTSGDRWLKGAYVDIDAFKSRLRTLAETHRPEKEVDEDEDAYSYIR